MTKRVTSKRHEAQMEDMDDCIVLRNERKQSIPKNVTNVLNSIVDTVSDNTDAIDKIGTNVTVLSNRVFLTNEELTKMKSDISTLKISSAKLQDDVAEILKIVKDEHKRNLVLRQMEALEQEIRNDKRTG